MNIYSWDICAQLFTLTTLATTLSYYAKPTIRNIFFIGISAAAMVLSRIPNIAGILPILFIIIYRQRKSLKILRDCAVGLSTFILSTIIIILIIYGNISQYISSWSPNNIITGHSDILIYFSSIINSVPECAEMCLPTAVTLILAYITQRWRPHNKLLTLISVMLIILAAGTAFMIYPARIHIYSYAIFLFIILYGFVYNHTHKTKLVYDSAIMWISVIFAIVPAIGSDVMAFKFMVIPIIPIVTAELYSHYSKDSFTIQVFKLFAVSTIVIFILFRVISLRTQNNTFSEYPQLTYINASSSIKEVIRNLNTICDERYSIAHVGTTKYIYDYLLTNNTGYNLQLYHYSQMDANDIKKDITDNLINYDIIRITLPVDGKTVKYVQLYDKYLQEYGYEQVSSNKLVYIKKGIPHDVILQ